MSPEVEKLIAALNALLKLVVTDSDQVSVESQDDNGIVLLQIAAPEAIVGQIIGKDGKIIKSLRTLLSVAFPDLRFNIQIKE